MNIAEARFRLHVNGHGFVFATGTQLQWCLFSGPMRAAGLGLEQEGKEEGRREALQHDIAPDFDFPSPGAALAKPQLRGSPERGKKQEAACEDAANSKLGPLEGE